MSGITVQRLRRAFGEVKAVDDVSFNTEEGEIFALLGPSGCGKTTILRSIAGFEQPDGGSIMIGQRDVTRIPAHERPVGMVFQAYALFPHLTVFDNVAYGLYAHAVRRGNSLARIAALARLMNRRLARPSEEIKQRVAKALATVELSGYEERFPSQLSGGQQQRVALARAIVVEPEVLLMDEPLSNLDRKLRDTMRITLRKLLNSIGITVIIVTHDQDEAMSMADRIAVMSSGKILQVGPPDRVYRQPHNRFVAEFIGDANILSGAVRPAEGGYRFETGDLSLPFAADSDRHDAQLAMIRPESVRLSDRADGAAAAMRAWGTVAAATYLGNSVKYEVQVGSLLLKVATSDISQVRKPGSEVAVTVDAEAVRLL
jgi:ABC-type Fe3+/spermidine/putrescine transport system ATPase subunit